MNMKCPQLSLAVMGALVLLTGVAGGQTPSPGARASPYSLPPREELEATRERPLFSPSRQPDAQPEPADPSESPVSEAPESLPFELTGIVMAGDVGIAIMRNRETQEAVHLRQGETLEQWSVEEIASRYVVLRSDDKELRLQLFEDKPNGSQPNAGPPPPRVQRPVSNLSSGQRPRRPGQPSSGRPRRER